VAGSISALVRTQAVSTPRAAKFVHYGKYDHRERGSLQVGGQAPDLDLTMYDGSSVRLSQLWGGAQPVFVVFGSCT